MLPYLAAAYLLAGVFVFYAGVKGHGDEMPDSFPGWIMFALMVVSVLALWPVALASVFFSSGQK